MYHNVVADTLQSEIQEEARVSLAEQKHIGTALVVSSRSRQLQGTMKLGLHHHATEEGDDEVCCVCFCSESFDDNKIVFCEFCDTAVHQSCYGIKTIPEDGWFCDCCARSCTPECVVCRKKGGAFKVCVTANRNASDVVEPPQWVHVLCALWHPAISFDSLAIMREVDLSNAELFMEKTCFFCNQSGYLMLCGCGKGYHPMCAWEGGWDTEQTEVVPPEFEMSCRWRPLTQQRVHDVLRKFHDYMPPCTVTAKCCDCTRSVNQPRVISAKIKKRKRKSTGWSSMRRPKSKGLPPKTILPDQFLRACMLCHYDKHNENRATLSRSRLMSCSGGCGASVHEGCAKPMQDDGCRRAIDGGTWTCMLCMEDKSLGEVQCCYCPRRGGLFQRCNDGWVHTVCARLIVDVLPNHMAHNCCYCKQVCP